MIDTKLGVLLTDNELKALKNLAITINCNDTNCRNCPFNTGKRCTMDIIYDIHDEQIRFRKALTIC